MIGGGASMRTLGWWVTDKSRDEWFCRFKHSSGWIGEAWSSERLGIRREAPFLSYEPRHARNCRTEGVADWARAGGWSDEGRKTRVRRFTHSRVPTCRTEVIGGRSRAESSEWHASA